MRYTIVYVSDDGMVSAYGTFTKRENAERRAERMERDLDEDRDEAGGGVGHVSVCGLQPFAAWV